MSEDDQCRWHLPGPDEPRCSNQATGTTQSIADLSPTPACDRHQEVGRILGFFKVVSDPNRCELVKKGVDTHIGAYYSAPCGWSTYNGWDISHYEWHRRGLAYCKHSKLALSKTRTCDGTKIRCPDCRSFRPIEEIQVSES